MPSNMRCEIELLKTDVSGLRGEVDGLRADVKRIDTQLYAVIVEQSRARGDIEWLKENMLTRGEFQTGMRKMMNHLDGLAGLIKRV